MSEMSNEVGPSGFVKAVLGKAWQHHEVGDGVWVDPERRKWLDENGYLTPSFDTHGSLGSMSQAVDLFAKLKEEKKVVVPEEKVVSRG